ncbi:uncharacterized protein [Trachinotus anak]|uniref:uncharacterized protein isoform X3 n=1 Tax=Trachinotus anak TaxID=443729 RepID=UPI0039F1A810
MKTSFGLQEDFRLQYQDADFGNEFVNLSVTSEIHDKATIKVVYVEVTFRAVEGEAVGMLEAPVMVLETIAAHRVIKGGRLKQSLMMESLDHRGLTPNAPQDTDTEANTSMEQTVMGVYVIQKEGAEAGDGPEDISVLIEGVEVLSGLGETAIAYALLFGLIYCLNLSYPPELKCTFEVLQKILLKLDYHPRHSS